MSFIYTTPLWVLIVGVFFFAAIISLVVGGIINTSSPVGYEDDEGFHEVDPIEPDDLKDN